VFKVTKAIFLGAFLVIFCLIGLIFVNNLRIVLTRSELSSSPVEDEEKIQEQGIDREMSSSLEQKLPLKDALLSRINNLKEVEERGDVLSFPRYKAIKPPVKEAMFYEELPGGRVKCKLCPWECTIKPGDRGICKVRLNQDGRLVTLCYSRPCTIHVDPIEKKPFYHFLPGEEAFSIATAGCNLGCKFCQNWQISQRRPEELDSFYIPPDGIIRLAKRSRSKIIAFTYSEPVVFYEYMLDIAKLAKGEGIKTVVVTGGFINPEPLRLLCRYVDAIKVDLKGFNEKYYKKVVLGKLKPILEAMKIIKEEGVHLEIVYLVVPILNDDSEEIKEMCRWIKENLGRDIPLHFSRFFPAYKMKDYPPTPLSTVERLRKIAIDEGLRYVYVGNVPPGHPGESTYCPEDGKLLIGRAGYEVVVNNIKDGRCKFDGTPIYGIFESSNQ